MCRAVPGDIDCVLDCVHAAGGKPSDASVLILSALSDLHIKYKLGKALLKREGKDEAAWLDTPLEFYREANIRMITSAVRYAREKGLTRVEFAAEDASRSDLAYALQWGPRQRGRRRHAILLFRHLRGVHPRRRGSLFPALVRELKSQEGAAS